MRAKPEVLVEVKRVKWQEVWKCRVQECDVGVVVVIKSSQVETSWWVG